MAVARQELKKPQNKTRKALLKPERRRYKYVTDTEMKI